jgi:hypothetical protein
VLTEDRAIIAIGANVRVVPLEGAIVELQARSGDAGTIWFGPAPPTFGATPNLPGSRKLPPGFELSSEARSVFDRILSAQRRDTHDRP